MKRASQLFMAMLSAVALVVLMATPALADPKKEGGLTENNPMKNVVRDPLAGTYAAPNAQGWVVFACESLEGFQYSISIKGLAPKTTYSLVAEAQDMIFAGVDESGSPIFLPTSDPGTRYALGSITTNREGEGELGDGLVSLPASNDILGIPLGLYAWNIQAFDPEGRQVLESGFDPVFGPDYADFIVLPYWGFEFPEP